MIIINQPTQKLSAITANPIIYDIQVPKYKISWKEIYFILIMYTHKRHKMNSNVFALHLAVDLLSLPRIGYSDFHLFNIALTFYASL